MVGLNRITAKIYAALRAAPKDGNHPYWRYAKYRSFADIRREVIFPPAYYSPMADDYPARVHAAWLGQIIGSSAGTQMEGYSTAQIVRVFGDITGYPREPETYNDDLMYPIAFLDIFAKVGYAVRSADIALNWAALIPDGYSAEEAALDSIRRGILPPKSGQNFFSDWIGAQMRTAIHGMVAPGNPALAAKLAWKDSIISHANNGALGGIFNAALVSLAFITEDARTLIHRAVRCVPAKSQYYSIIRRALDVCEDMPDWRRAWAILEEENKRYHWIHAYPNAAAEVVALYYGGGDFDATLNIICQAGRDTDCNAGQVLAALCAMKPVIPEKWIAPLQGGVRTYMRSYREFTPERIAEKTVCAARDAWKHPS